MTLLSKTSQTTYVCRREIHLMRLSKEIVRYKSWFYLTHRVLTLWGIEIGLTFHFYFLNVHWLWMTHLYCFYHPFDEYNLNYTLPYSTICPSVYLSKFVLSKIWIDICLYEDMMKGNNGAPFHYYFFFI